MGQQATSRLLWESLRSYRNLLQLCRNRGGVTPGWVDCVDMNLGTSYYLFR